MSALLWRAALVCLAIHGAAAGALAQSGDQYFLGPARGGNAAIAHHASAFRNYNYDPTAMRDGGLYRVWWCANHEDLAGDRILYAESRSLAGPWHARGSSAANSFDVVFHGTGDMRDFDGLHTCDPTVIKVGATYYMYYTGAHVMGELGPNAIGVASSPDGMTWTRMNAGKPIVAPANRQRGDGYGAGEQSVTHANGYFYMMYNDHSGAAALSNGAGEFVLRATDPLFRDNVMALTRDGFAPLTKANETAYSAFNGNNMDVQYAPAWRKFIAIGHSDSGVAHVVVFDENFGPLADRVIAATQWCDGPGLVGDAERHAIMRAKSRPGASGVAIDILRAVGDCRDPFSWKLAWRGADLWRRSNAPRAAGVGVHRDRGAGNE